METVATHASASALFKNFSYIVAVFVSLSPESYSILAVFMIVDTFTGIVRSGVIKGWKSVTSHELTSGILAKCLVILVPFLLALAGKGIGLQLDIIAKSALNVLILSELYSILSNIQSIRLKKDIAEFDAVNYLLGTLRAFLEKNVKTKTNIK